MKFDPGKKMNRLAAGKAVEHWFARLDWVRECRTRYMKAYAGPRYGRYAGNAASSYRSMLPLVQTVGRAYAQLLAYSAPRYRFEPKDRSNLAFAKNWEAALNARVEAMHFEKILQECAIDAFLFYTVMKTYRGGSPVGRVSPDDFVFDAGLKDIRRSPFFGDRYRVPLDWCLNNDAMDKSIVSKWKPVRRSERGTGDEAWRLNDGGDSDEGEFTEMVELADVYFPEVGHVGCWPVRGNFEMDMEQKPALWLPWRQNEFGCYRMCSFINMPDNSIPLSPVAGIYDIQLFVNTILRKVAFRAANQKDVLGFQAGAEGDARRAKSAGEIELVQMNDPVGGVKVHKLLGVDQPLWSLLLSMHEMFKQYAGNLDASTGMDPTAETLGQSQQIMSRVLMREGEMRARWVQFMAEVGEDIADDMYDNPDLKISTSRKTSHPDLNIAVSWLPPEEQDRPATIDDMEIKVIPESSMYRSSEDKLANLVQTIQLTMPLAALGMQQGTVLNVRRVVERIADLKDDPDLVELWDYNAMDGQQPQPGEEQQPMKPGGPHEYIHRAAGSNPGGSGGRMQSLLAGMSSGGGGDG